ncbi:hypothetical protein ACFLV2_00630 [Chloroflexota bacterium]
MPNPSGKAVFRSLVFILTQPFLPPMGILPIFIHEASHYFIALAAGIPSSDIIFAFIGDNPGVVIPATVSPEFLPYFFYAGGIISGTFLLFIYLFYWIKQSRLAPSLANWIMGMTTVIAMSLQFYMGILEGMYQQSYGGRINDIYLVLWVMIFVVCHAIIFHLVSRRKKTVF